MFSAESRTFGGEHFFLRMKIVLGTIPDLFTLLIYKTCRLYRIIKKSL